MVRPSAVGRRSIGLLIYGIIVVASLVSYFTSYPIPEIREKFAALLSVFFLVLSMMATGHLVFDLIIKNKVNSGSSKLTFETLMQFGAMGFGVISLAVLLLGWLSIGSLRIKFLILILILAVLSFRFIRIHNKRWPKFTTPSIFQFSELLFIVLIIFGSFVCFLSCFSPITYYDSLVYHLALPSLYIQWDAIRPVSTNLYSFFPENAEMVFLLLLSQFPSPEYAVNLLGWAFSMGIAFVIGQWAYEEGGRSLAFLSMALWWTMPAVMLLSVGGYVDIFLAGFIFLSARSFYLSHSNNEWRWMIIAGLFSGFAYSTKYTGATIIILIALIGILVPLDWKKNHWKWVAGFLMASLIPAFPWMLKNLLTIGNPVFPFLYKWLGKSVGWTEASAQGYFTMLTDYGAKSYILFELFLAPWKIIGSSVSFGGGFDVLGDFGWFLIIFGAPAAILFSSNSKTVRTLSIIFWGYFLIWFFTKPVLRFLVGILPAAAILAAVAIHHLWNQSSKIVGGFTKIITGLCLTSNLFIYFFIADGLKPFSVALGLETRDNYLQRRLPYYPTFSHLNAMLTSQDKVLLIGEQRTYHLQVPYLSSNLFAPSPISIVCNQAVDTEELFQFMTDNGITHIVINEGEIERLGGWGKFGFSEKGSHNLERFLDSKATLLTSDRRIQLYSVSRMN